MAASRYLERTPVASVISGRTQTPVLMCPLKLDRADLIPPVGAVLFDEMRSRPKKNWNTDQFSPSSKDAAKFAISPPNPGGANHSPFPISRRRLFFQSSLNSDERF